MTHEREMLERIEVLEANTRRIEGLLIELDRWIVGHHDMHKGEVTNHLGLHRTLEAMKGTGN